MDLVVGTSGQFSVPNMGRGCWVLGHLSYDPVHLSRKRNPNSTLELTLSPGTTQGRCYVATFDVVVVRIGLTTTFKDLLRPSEKLFGTLDNLRKGVHLRHIPGSDCLGVN